MCLLISCLVLTQLILTMKPVWWPVLYHWPVLHGLCTHSFSFDLYTYIRMYPYSGLGCCIRRMHTAKGYCISGVLSWPGQFLSNTSCPNKASSSHLLWFAHYCRCWLHQWCSVCTAQSGYVQILYVHTCHHTTTVHTSCMYIQNVHTASYKQDATQRSW